MLTEQRKTELALLANEIRKETVKCIASVGIGHLGGSLSIVDLLAVLYFDQMKLDPTNPKNPDRDMLVCSKGHAGPAIYSALAMKGYFDNSLLSTLNQPNTDLPSHCDMRKTPGIDMTTGSLGQGISAACGIALANQMDGKEDLYTYAIMGDGESQEGQIWEAAMFAAHRKLSNLIAFVDNNNLQIDGTVDQVCSLGDIAEKYRSFGWDAVRVNGHDVEAIHNAVENAKTVKDKPSVIVLDTVKGKGIKAIENQASNHNMNVGPEQLEAFLKELDEEACQLKGGCA